MQNASISSLSLLFSKAAVISAKSFFFLFFFFLSTTFVTNVTFVTFWHIFFSPFPREKDHHRSTRVLVRAQGINVSRDEYEVGKKRLADGENDRRLGDFVLRRTMSLPREAISPLPRLHLDYPYHFEGIIFHDPFTPVCYLLSPF